MPRKASFPEPAANVRLTLPGKLTAIDAEPGEVALYIWCADRVAVEHTLSKANKQI
jgi:hypothetical protein